MIGVNTLATYSAQSTAIIRVMSSVGSPTDVSTITMVTSPAWGIPAAPILAAVAVILVGVWETRVVTERNQPPHPACTRWLLTRSFCTLGFSDLAVGFCLCLAAQLYVILLTASVKKNWSIQWFPSEKLKESRKKRRAMVAKATTPMLSFPFAFIERRCIIPWWITNDGKIFKRWYLSQQTSQSWFIASSGNPYNMPELAC